MFLDKFCALAPAPKPFLLFVLYHKMAQVKQPTLLQPLAGGLLAKAGVAFYH